MEEWLGQTCWKHIDKSFLLFVIVMRANCASEKKEAPFRHLTLGPL